MSKDYHILLMAARHGTTDENEQNIFRGDTNPSLDEQGFRDANELSFYLQPVDFSYIFTTGKRRTVQTAKVIAEGRRVQPVANCGLFPWNTGVFGGQPKNAENKKKLQYYIENPDVSIPDGESLNEFKCRVIPLLQDAVQLGFDSPDPVLLVIHSSVMHELGELITGNHEDAHVKPGGVSIVYMQDGKLGIEPVFKVDERATSQNVLGSIRSGRSSISS